MRMSKMSKFEFDFVRVKGHQLSCVRGGKRIFNHIDFAVKNGDALIVTGANGVGKTSLLRIVAGLLNPYSGVLEMPAKRSSCHYLAHNNALKSRMTVSEMLIFWTQFMNVSLSSSCVGYLLEQVGLETYTNIRISDLSTGQARRLAFTRLISVRRPIWLLDEPFNTLDDSARQWITERAFDHLSCGGIIIAATHETLCFETQKLSMMPLGRH